MKGCMGAPAAASAGSSQMPSCAPPSPSSSFEQSMPKLSTPRSFPFLMAKPPGPGMTAPILASGAFTPTRTFGAPQTIWSVSVPSKTLHTCRWSESGCGTQSTTSPTTKCPSSTVPVCSTASTSTPEKVSRSATCCGVWSRKSTNSFSQLNGTRIVSRSLQFNRPLFYHKSRPPRRRLTWSAGEGVR